MNIKIKNVTTPSGCFKTITVNYTSLEDDCLFDKITRLIKDEAQKELKELEKEYDEL